MRARGGVAFCAVLAAALAACNPSGDFGYVEVRRNASANAAETFALNATPLAELQQRSSTVMRQPVGRIALELRRGERVFTLCSFDLRKNRIVTVTIASVAGTLRCSVQT